MRSKIRAYLVVCGLVVALQPFHGTAQQNSEASKTTADQQTSTERDGQHDFRPSYWRMEISSEAALASLNRLHYLG